MKHQKHPTRRTAIALAVATFAACIVLIVLAKGRTDDPREAASPPPAASAEQPPSGTAAVADSTGDRAGPVGAATAPRPLPVARSSATHEWTGGNQSDPALIDRIAHNNAEYMRMVDENDRIERRQLVYRKQPAVAVVQRARAAGEPVRSLLLPALDGEELVFEIERADLAPSGLSGSFAGHLAGKPNSMVTLAFKLGREAFTVQSPDDDFYLQADPREPGEVIVKRIDPETYLPLSCGTPDYLAQNTAGGAR